MQVQTGDLGQNIGVAGAPATAFGIHDHRQALLLRQFTQAVQLGVMKETLGSREHRVVIDNDSRSRRCLAHPLGVDGCSAGDDAVGGGAGLQLLIVTAATLGGNRQLAVFLKAVGVHQVSQILPGGPVAGTVASFPGLRPACIQGPQEALSKGQQFRAQLIIHGAALALAAAARLSPAASAAGPCLLPPAAGRQYRRRRPGHWHAS